MCAEQKKDYQISVIVPVYNVEDYLEECLESLTVQSIGLNNFEVIMVNDSSTDNSGQIMDRYSKKYDNFTAVHLPQNSGGAGHPRNVGIQRAVGKYIMFLDSDDKYMPDTCKIMYDAISTYESDIVIAGHNYFRKESEGSYKPVDEIVVNTSLYKQPQLLNIPPATWSKIYRKEFILKHNLSFPANAIGEDAVFVFKYMMAAEKITALPVLIYKYRIRENQESPSLTQNISKTFFKEYNDTQKLLVDAAKQYKIDYISLKFHLDMDYFLWMLSRSIHTIEEQDIASIFESYYWFVKEGEKYLPNCRVSDKIIIKKILDRDFTGASKAMLSFSDFRELEAIIVQQKRKLELLRA